MESWLFFKFQAAKSIAISSGITGKPGAAGCLSRRDCSERPWKAYMSGGARSDQSRAGGRPTSRGWEHRVIRFRYIFSG